MVKPIIDQIVDNGTVKRAYLGVVLQPIDKELGSAMGLDKTEGVLISDIVNDSPAQKAGLQQGDIILEYNGAPVRNMNKFRNDIAMSAGQIGVVESRNADAGVEFDRSLQALVGARCVPRQRAEYGGREMDVRTPWLDLQSLIQALFRFVKTALINETDSVVIVFIGRFELYFTRLDLPLADRGVDAGAVGECRVGALRRFLE
jgi:hypothetical protein